MRPVFVGNFEYETRQSELERLFGKYGRFERVDMKSGYAFVYFEDERDAEDAIRKLDNYPFGYEKRRLSVEWAKGERGRARGDGKPASNLKPTKTLFVINFDPIRTKEHDIEKHFEPYGKVINVRIRRNFSFVQFETQEDATKALEATQRSKILDRVVSVEYALKDDDERDDRYGGRSPRRSLSPVYRRLPQRGNDLCQIQQGLFIGSVAEASNKDLLKSSNVTHVLTVVMAFAPPYPDHFVYKVIEVVDRSETDLTVYFDECFSFIDQAIQSGGGVLVHCFMGMSRSVTIVVAYLMKKYGMGFSKAMELVKSRRPQALPNFGFISQLQQFEKSIQGQNSKFSSSCSSAQANSPSDLLLDLAGEECSDFRLHKLFNHRNSSITGLFYQRSPALHSAILFSLCFSLLAFYFCCISFPL